MANFIEQMCVKMFVVAVIIINGVEYMSIYIWGGQIEKK